jgi:hypothetical protein
MKQQEFTNIYFYYLFIITLFAGIIFYDIIGFKAADEICGGLLLVLFFKQMFTTPDWPINKVFLFTLFIFSFYFLYSVYIGSNSIKAIGTDLIIQIKPYLVFFCTYQLMPKFNENQKKILQDTSLLFWFLFLPIGLIGATDEHFFNHTVGHPSCYAAIITALSFTYLYCGKFTKKEKLIFFIMLAAGIASGRSKFYGFYVFALFVELYLSKSENLKLNTKNIVASLILISVMVFVAREKLDLYFIQGMSESSENKDLIARFMLYSTSFFILIDYIPFGSGLASFATHASAIHYSSIYTEYGIDYVWGLSKTYNKFIADTYYPSLAQFGIVGIILFVSFWIYILCKSIKCSKKINNAQLFTIACLIIGYLFIENIADASFTSNKGLFMMIFLGLIVANQKELILNHKHIEQITTNIKKND